MSVETRVAATQPEYVIRNWLVWQESPQTCGWGVVVGLVLAWVYWWTSSSEYVVGVALLLAVTFWRYWIPVEYRVSARGFEESRWGVRRTVPWYHFLSCEPTQHGLLLVHAPQVAGARLSAPAAVRPVILEGLSSPQEAVTPRLVTIYVRCQPTSEAAQAIGRYIRLEARRDRGSSHSLRSSSAGALGKVPESVGPV